MVGIIANSNFITAGFSCKFPKHSLPFGAIYANFLPGNLHNGPSLFSFIRVGHDVGRVVVAVGVGLHWAGTAAIASVKTSNQNDMDESFSHIGHINLPPLHDLDLSEGRYIHS